MRQEGNQPPSIPRLAPRSPTHAPDFRPLTGAPGQMNPASRRGLLLGLDHGSELAHFCKQDKQAFVRRPDETVKIRRPESPHPGYFVAEVTILHYWHLVASSRSAP